MTDGTEVAQGGMNAVARVIGIVTSPARTMADIVARPSWVVPVLLAALVAAGTTYLLYESTIVPMQMERIERNPNMTGEQLQRAEEQMNSPVARAIGSAAPAIILPLIMLIQAGVLLFIGSLILGGQTTFRTIFAVSAWSGVIYVVATLVQSPVYAFATHRMEPVASLAFLLPSDAPSGGVRFLRGLLGSIDVFQLWGVAVQAIGVSIAYKRPRSFGWTCAGALWVVGALIAGVSSMLSGGAG